MTELIDRPAPTGSHAPDEARQRGDALASYLADHPLAYAASLAASGGTALYALAVGARRGHGHQVLWLALGAHCAAQVAGIVATTELKRRKAASLGAGD
jgi:hypothetical protein